MNTKPTVGNIGEATAVETGEARETTETGETGTKLGIEIRGTAAESVEATMPMVGNRQPYGPLHGGAMALLTEHTASITIGAWAATHGMTAVRTNLTITHVRPAQSGTVRYMVQAQRLGRRTIVYAFQVVSKTSGKLTSSGLVGCQSVAKSPDGVS